MIAAIIVLGVAAVALATVVAMCVRRSDYDEFEATKERLTKGSGEE